MSEGLNEFLLQDRVQKIQQIITKYGERNFYVVYTGSEENNALCDLLDMAMPNNQIPRIHIRHNHKPKSSIRILDTVSKAPPDAVQCVTYDINGEPKTFSPLAVVTEEWLEWFVNGRK